MKKGAIAYTQWAVTSASLRLHMRIQARSSGYRRVEEWQEGRMEVRLERTYLLGFRTFCVHGHLSERR